MALQTENLPPTKSQNPKTFYGAIPNCPVNFRFVEHAQICCLTIFSVEIFSNFLYPSNNHFLQLWAFRIVSAVVKVFELTKIRVSSTFNPWTALSKSIGSTFAKNLRTLPSEAFL